MLACLQFELTPTQQAVARILKTSGCSAIAKNNADVGLSSWVLLASVLFYVSQLLM